MFISTCTKLHIMHAHTYPLYIVWLTYSNDVFPCAIWNETSEHEIGVAHAVETPGLRIQTTWIQVLNIFTFYLIFLRGVIDTSSQTRFPPWEDGWSCHCPVRRSPSWPAGGLLCVCTSELERAGGRTALWASVMTPYVFHAVASLSPIKLENLFL